MATTPTQDGHFSHGRPPCETERRLIEQHGRANRSMLALGPGAGVIGDASETSNIQLHALRGNSTPIGISSSFTLSLRRSPQENDRCDWRTYGQM